MMKVFEERSLSLQRQVVLAEKCSLKARDVALAVGAMSGVAWPIFQVSLDDQ